jgi:hypothetical protein
VHWP